MAKLMFFFVLYAILATTSVTSSVALRPFRAHLDVLSGIKLNAATILRKTFDNTPLDVLTRAQLAQSHHDHATEHNYVPKDDSIVEQYNDVSSCSHFEEGDQETIWRCKRMLREDYSPVGRNDNPKTGG